MKLVLLLAILPVLLALKPILVTHGINGHKEEYQPLLDTITKAHPGTPVVYLGKLIDTCIYNQ
jgi:hypothetical protein